MPELSNQYFPMSEAEQVKFNESWVVSRLKTGLLSLAAIGYLGIETLTGELSLDHINDAIVASACPFLFGSFLLNSIQSRPVK